MKKSKRKNHESGDDKNLALAKNLNISANFKHNQEKPKQSNSKSKLRKTKSAPLEEESGKPLEIVFKIEVDFPSS